MKSKPRFNSRQQLLIVAAVTLLPLGGAQATDLYDSLKAWEKQPAEAQKYRDSMQTATPPAQVESADPSGAQGPIRSETIEDRPATEPAAPQADEQKDQAQPESENTR